MSIFSVSSNVSGINVGSSWCKAVYLGTTAVFYETYTAGALSPELALDFASEYYRTGGTDTDLVSATTHARAGNATMVDSDGLLKWGPHNLLPESEVFSGYTNSNVSLTTGQIDPKGTTTATRVTTTGANAYMIKDSGVELTGNSSIWVRRVSGSGNVDFRSIDNNTSNILTLTSVWQKFTSAQAFSANARFRLQIADSGDVIDIWGAHVYRSDLGGMVDNPARGDSYVPTTGSARYLPRVGHHLYDIEQGAQVNPLGPELVTNGAFDTDTDWTLGTGWEILGGELVAASVGNGQYVTSTAFSVTAGKGYLVSVEVTEVTSGSISFRFDSGANEVELGTVSSSGSYEFPVVAADASSVAAIRSLGFSGTIDNISVREVNPWVDEGYFHESEARTNLVTSSEDFTDASWVKAGAPTTTAGQTNSLTGQSDATLLAASSAVDTKLADTIGVTGSTAYSHSVFAKASASNWLLVFSTGIPNSGAWFDLSTGSLGTVQASATATIEDVGGGWYRCNTTATSGAIAITVFTVELASGNNSSTAASGDSILIYGAQVEAGSTPSSYIPTSGSTVTSAADTMTVPSANLPWNPLAVSIQMEGTMTYADRNKSTASNPAGEVVFVAWQADTDNEIYATVDTFSDRVGRVEFGQDALGTHLEVRGPDDTYSPGINIPFNISSRHGSTFINGAVDGVALTANTTPVALPDLSATDMDIGPDFMGTIKLFRVWADDLTDAGIEDASA